MGSKVTPLSFRSYHGKTLPVGEILFEPPHLLDITSDFHLPVTYFHLFPSQSSARFKSLDVIYDRVSGSEGGLNKLIQRWSATFVWDGTTCNATLVSMLMILEFN